MSRAVHHHTRARRSALWLIAGLTAAMVVLIAVVLIVALLRPRAPLVVPGAQQVTLDDGTTFFVKATYGQEHSLGYQVPDPRPLERLTSPMRSDSHWRDTSQDRYVVWLAGRNPPTGKPLDFTWWSHSSVVDSHGCVVEDEEAHRYAYSELGGGGGGTQSRPMEPLGQEDRDAALVIACSRLPVFRTNNSKFTLRLHDTSGRIVAKVPLPRLHPAAVPEWEPEPLPSTKKVGDLTVTLSAVTADERKSEVGRDDREVGILRLRPQYAAVWKGQPSDKWTRRQVVVCDALGNCDTGPRCKLCRHEQAWKLTLNLQRQEDADFAAEETWTIKDVLIPGERQTRRLTQVRNVMGARLELRTIGGPGQVVYRVHDTAPKPPFPRKSGGGSFQFPDNELINYHVQSQWSDGIRTQTIEAPRPHVVLALDEASLRHDVLLRAKDDQGRDVATRTTYRGDLWLYFLDTQPDAKSVDLTFILNREFSFNFFIEPPEPE